jgi:hypothetical protein
VFGVYRHNFTGYRELKAAVNEGFEVAGDVLLCIIYNILSEKARGKMGKCEGRTNGLLGAGM